MITTNYTFKKWAKKDQMSKISEEGKKRILEFNRYRKDFHYKSTFMLLLYTSSSDNPSCRNTSIDMLNDNIGRAILGHHCDHKGKKRIHHSHVARLLQAFPIRNLEETAINLCQQYLKNSGISKDMQYKMIDSTTIPLNKHLYPEEWANFRSTKSGIKMHLAAIYVDGKAIIPDNMEMTDAKTNDSQVLDFFTTEPGMTYVFDRSYPSYDVINKLTNAGMYFVTRCKDNFIVNDSNIKYSKLQPKEAGVVLEDGLVSLGIQDNKHKHTDAVRFIRYKTKDGKVYTYLTNRFDLDAYTVAQMYKNRWLIELLFKHLKGSMALNHALSRDEECVKKQLYLILISVLLTELMLLKINQRYHHQTSFQKLSRVLHALWFEDWEVFLIAIKDKRIFV